MSTPLSNQIEAAYAELAHTRDRISALRQKAEAVRTTVVAKNHAVSVTVDSRGDLAELRFPTGAYRSMAPVELADLIVNTIRTARAESMATLTQTYREHLPADSPVRGLMDGDFDVDFDSMIEKAMRLATQPFPRTPDSAGADE